MTLVRIDAAFASEEQLLGLSSVLHQVMLETLDLNESDKVHILRGRGSGVIVYDRDATQPPRDAGFVIVQIFLDRETTISARQGVDAELRKGIARIGFKPQNLALSIVDGSPAGWFPGV